VAAVVSTTCTFRLAIFSDDSGNNNPDTMVLNSQSAELSHSTTTLTKVSNAYGTKPQVTGGSVYWLAYLTSNGNCQFDKLSQASPVINVYYWATTYPTWPSAAQWDSGADSEEDGGVYAIYQ
jgi:hypothetical protein